MDAAAPLPTEGEGLAAGTPQTQLLDFFFPGFSVFSSAVQKYLHIDLNLYIPLVLLFGGLTFAWRYFSEYFSGLAESHLMSTVDVRPDDEIYNMLMAWVASQRFSQGARRFVVNTNLNSRSWYLWRSFDDDDEDSDGEGNDDYRSRKKKKALAYTPTFGSHWFLYKGRILIFRRTQNSTQSAFLTASEREEISISCFGRNPWVLKELLHEAKDEFMKRDEAKTLIYRGTTKSGSSEPQWQRCMARTSRPFSTVILNEKVKQDLIDDVTDYLNPATRRWYANRGIPYRRGYLLYGPPGTGKSSLSLALAGFFKMRIYIVSLSSVTANEENLASLFAELPRRCVVLLEDIDTAGLTHTRDDANQPDADADNNSDTITPTTPSRKPGQPGAPNPANTPSGRLSLSGLLNILDGVASQEGRVLIMTTNHLEKLDKALIRPGRVDMTVKFDRADTGMISAIFRAIFAPIEGDDAPSSSAKSASSSSSSSPSSSRALFQLESTLKAAVLTPEEEKKRAAEAAEAARKREATIARVEALAARFAGLIPAHEFSPAEIQGWLLKNKRDPEKAVEGAEGWVAASRQEKKEKELKEAEEKRAREKKEAEEKEAEEKKEREEKEKEKEEGKKGKKAGSKGKKKKAKKSSKRKSVSKGSGSEDDGSASGSSSSESESESESEKEREKEKRKRKSKPAAAAAAPSPPAPASAAVADAPVELKADDAPAVTAEPVVAIPTIKVDTEKAKAADVEAHRTPGADSGYGTPA